MKIGILEPDGFSLDAIAQLKKFARVSLFSQGKIEDFVHDKEVLFVRLSIHLHADFLKHAKKLSIICSPTTGLNHIDTAYCKSKQIQIISLKGEHKFLKSIRATPEHSLGLILALKRNYKQAFLNTGNSEWNRDLYRGEEIYKSKIGIIGLGRVGKLLAKYLDCFGAELSYVDIKPLKTPARWKRQRSIQQLISHCDTIVLCSSFSPEQGTIINKKEIDALKGKYFINTARAELTDETYLAKKANQAFFKGLAIDVIQNEQSSKLNLEKLLKAAEKNNIIITPHIGGATHTSMKRTEEFIAEKLSRFIGK